MAGSNNPTSGVKGQELRITGTKTEQTGQPGGPDAVTSSGPAGLEGLAIPTSGPKVDTPKDDTFDRLLNSGPPRDPRDPRQRKGK